MKKITYLLFSVLFTSLLTAQLPANEFFRYEFTNGSNANTAFTSASDLTNTFVSIADRNNSAGDAADITGLMNGANLGGVNYNNSTLSFWLKTPAITNTQRVLQMYGTNGNGYRVELNTSSIMINARVEGGGSFIGGVATAIADLDDDAWHHIVVLTGPSASFDAIIFEMYIDGVNVNLSGNNIISPSATVTNFLLNATFVIDPLNAYSGNLDDIYGYRSTLTNTEVTQLYNYYPAPPPTRYYVDKDATGNNDGSSWADAFTDLRDAFTNSYDGMEIWVADGTYRRTGTDRNLTFGWGSDSLKVYGGFNGTETMFSQRDWRVNETILSGDLGVVGNSSDNCYTTLVGPVGTASSIISYSLIDGLIIQDGNSNGSGNDLVRYGGGFFSTDYVAQTDIKNCIFTNNNALYGAASASTYATDKTVNFENCIFENNTATSAAAVHSRAYNGFDLNTKLVNCLFVNNEANSDVAGTNQSTLFYFGVNGSATLNIDILNSTISNNTNLYAGPNDVGMTLIYAQQNASTKNVTMKNNIVWNNVNDDVLFIKHSSGNDFTALSLENSISDLSSSLTNYAATAVINSDPLFTNPANDDFTLQSGSPAIDAGLQAGLSLPSLDLAGNSRVEGADVDMGCYEKSCAQFTFQITENNGVLSAPTNFVSYQWSFDGNDITGATSATYTPTQSGLYTVEVSDGNCPKTQTYFFCGNDLVTISENNGVITAPAGYSNYDWYKDGVYQFAAGNTDTFAVSQDGAYYCEVLLGGGANACIFTSNTISICSSVNVSITESNGVLTATSGYTDYQWFLDGTAINGATSETYTATQDGVYTCDATDNGCTATSNAITIQTATGISTLAFDFIKVYPNPTQGILNVELQESLSSIRLITITGQEVAHFEVTDRSLDISGLNAGIYFLELKNDQAKSITKVILQ